MVIDPGTVAQQQIWAAWVQAAGSIVAIVTAGYFPIWHLRVANRHRQKLLTTTLRSLGAEVLQMAESVYEALRTDGTRFGTSMHASPNEYEPLLAALDRFPTPDLEQRIHLIWWINLTRYARHADHMWRYTVTEGANDQVDWSEWRDAAEGLALEVAGATEAMV